MQYKLLNNHNYVVISNEVKSQDHHWLCYNYKYVAMTMQVGPLLLCSYSENHSRLLTNPINQFWLFNYLCHLSEHLNIDRWHIISYQFWSFKIDMGCPQRKGQVVCSIFMAWRVFLSRRWPKWAFEMVGARSKSLVISYLLCLSWSWNVWIISIPDYCKLSPDSFFHSCGPLLREYGKVLTWEIT
jgi:hypothetical protein